MEREIESSAADRVKSQRDDLAKFLGQLADRLGVAIGSLDPGEERDGWMCAMEDAIAEQAADRDAQAGKLREAERILADAEVIHGAVSEYLRGRVTQALAALRREETE